MHVSLLILESEKLFLSAIHSKDNSSLNPSKFDNYFTRIYENYVEANIR
jgi:hypothetical protein